MKQILVILPVTLVMSYLVVILGPVRVMEVGVVLRLYVAEEVNSNINLYTHLHYVFVVCPPLNNPFNGKHDCSLGGNEVAYYKDSCSFSCNIGYKLTGDATRTCQSDGNWSGREATCRKG